MATKTNLFANNVPASEWNGSAFVSTISVTVPSGAGALSLRISGDDTAPASVTLKASSDQALTQTLFTTDNDSQGIGFYTLTSPEAGTFDLEINTGGAQRTYYGIVDSIAGTSGVGDSDSGTAYTTGSTLTLTTTVGDLVLDIINAGASATSGADQTDDITPSGRTHASSLVADDTSEAMSWTLASQRWAHAAVVFTDGGGTPSATAELDDESLTYGAAFTGTLANMDPVPTSLTISDGTRSATVAITIDAGTFAGTMPALPVAGAEQAAGSQVYPGGVTMTVGGVEIETMLALEPGDDSIIVGASPVYSAWPTTWTEAQRPATGDCVIWDDLAGEIEFFADLTVDVNVEVTDGYLCIIRADGAAEANAFQSVGISEIGAVDPEPSAVGVLRFRKPRADKPSGRRPTVRQP